MNVVSILSSYLQQETEQTQTIPLRTFEIIQEKKEKKKYLNYTYKISEVPISYQKIKSLPVLQP